MTSSDSSLSELMMLRTAQLNQLAFNQAISRMATGSCLSSGDDNPAALLAGTSMEAELAGVESELSANERASNVADTASAGLDQISDLLNQAKALVEANANISGLSNAEKQANQSQFDSILSAINRIAGSTNFAGNNLLDGTASVSADGNTLSIDSAMTSDLGQTNIDGTDYNLSDLGSGQSLDTTGPNATNAATVLDAAINDVATQQGQIGAFVSDTLEPSYGDILSQRENLLGSLSSIADTNYAMESAAAIRTELLGQTSLLLLSGFNKQEHVQSLVLSVLG